MNRWQQLFPGPYPIIGMIHLPPLPDYAASPGIERIVESALADLQALAAADLDGVLIENEYDRPHRVLAEAATIEAMTRVTRAVVEERRDLAVGCEILLHDPQASLRVAAESGAGFIRSDYFVDRMSRPGYGEFAIDPQRLLAYRASIGADAVLILADIQVKYATMLQERPLAESARLASAHQADAVVVTGRASGDAPDLEQLRAAMSGADVPVLIGSGLKPDNIGQILPASDGAIAGTALMRDRRIDAAAVRDLMAEVRRVRSA